MSAGTVYEVYFSKEKNSLFFPILSECLLPAKTFARVAKPAIYVSVEVFGDNNFWKIYNLSHFFRTLIQKTLSRKENFFPGCHNCNPHVQRHFLRKSIFFKKKFVCSSVLEFEQLFLSTDKKQSGCQWNKLLIQKKVGGKNLWKNCFLNHHRTSSRKVWTIRQKILAGLSKLHSKSSEEHF